MLTQCTPLARYILLTKRHGVLLHNPQQEQHHKDGYSMRLIKDAHVPLLVDEQKNFTHPYGQKVKTLHSVQICCK